MTHQEDVLFDLESTEDTAVDITEDTYNESDDYEADLLELLEKDEPVMPSIIEWYAEHLIEREGYTKDNAYTEAWRIYSKVKENPLSLGAVLKSPQKEWTYADDLKPIEPTIELQDAPPSVPGTLTWDMLNIVDEENEFFSRRQLLSQPPEFIVTENETGTTVRVSVTKKAAEELAMTFTAVERIYNGLPPVPEPPRKLGFKGRVQQVVNWWKRRKIVGSFLGILLLLATLSLLNGFRIMFTVS